MQIQKNILLAPYTTFKIGGPAKFFCEVFDQFDALQAYEFAKVNDLKTFVLGGGSNVVISDEGFDGLVLKVKNKGIEIVSEDDREVTLKVASGETWDEVVSFAVKNNWWGAENLSHIPGGTGAIAVQNVGAYGQEAKNIIDSVVVFNKETHEIQSLKNEDCGFSYRSSIFNSTEKGKYIIFYIFFTFSKIPAPILSYRDLQAKFSAKVPGLLEIREAVIQIRDKKFPFPTEAKKGNAGSFFKNPVLENVEYKQLAANIKANFGSAKLLEMEKKKFAEGANIKVPAAFLVELCGLKDVEIGGAAINQNQPLVIINQSGEATAADVLDLAEEVRRTVLEKAGISLSFEPELVGFE